MSYRLFVRPVPPLADPGADPGAQTYNWVLLDAGGDAQARGTGQPQSEIEQALTQNALENVLLIGLIPGDEAMFCFADIPAKQTRFVQQALPYAVEEQIAQDIDSVHLALGRRDESGFRVAAIDRGRMSGWRDLFAEWEGARLEAIYADAALLPVTDGGWSVCLDGEFALIASDRGEWLRVRSANLAMFAQTLALPPSDEVIAEVPVTVYGVPRELEEHQSVIGGLASEGRLTVRQEPLELMPLELLAHSLFHHASHPINLCQGEFSIRRDSESRLKPWRPLIAVACVWFVVQVAVEVGLGFYYRQQADDLSSQAMAIYRQSFPEDRRTHAGNVRRVLEGQMRLAGAAGPDTGFITLMKYAGEQYSNLPGREAVSFNSVNYSRSRGELVVDLYADSYDKLAALRSGLADKGLEANIGSVVNEANGARGRLTVSGG